MNTFLMWANKGERKPKVQGKATAQAAALTIYDFSRMAKSGRGRFYIVDAETAEAARKVIHAWDKESGRGIDVPVGETKFDGGGKITAIGARANQALEGAGVAISKWDERLAKQGKVTWAQSRALPNPRGGRTTMKIRRRRRNLTRKQVKASRKYKRGQRKARLRHLKRAKARGWGGPGKIKKVKRHARYWAANGRRKKNPRRRRNPGTSLAELDQQYSALARKHREMEARGEKVPLDSLLKLRDIANARLSAARIVFSTVSVKKNPRRRR